MQAKVLERVEMARATGIAIVDPIEATRPLGEHFERFLKKKRPEVGEAHARKARQTLQRAIEQQRWHTARDITAESIEQHLEDLGVGPKTHNIILDHAAKFCDFLINARPPAMAVNPAKSVSRRRVLHGEYRGALSDEEIRLFRDATMPKSARAAFWPLDRLFWDLAIEAGLRGGETHGIKIGHVRLDGLAPFIKLPAENTKSGRLEAVPLTRYACQQLEPFVSTRQSEKRLFAVHYGGKEVIRRPPVALLHKVLESVGISPKDFEGKVIDNHALRHTCGHVMFRAGATVPEVQKTLRHRDARTTMQIYAKAGFLETAAAIQKVDKYTGEVAG